MKVVVQRSNYGKVEVNKEITGEIGKGLVLLVGFTEGDDETIILDMVNKIIKLRIFDDNNGIMNKSIQDIDGAKILSISQFTLYADTAKGNRPSYHKALSGDLAVGLYHKFNQLLCKFIPVETGIFGAEMEVTIINDGPVTILLER